MIEEERKTELTSALRVFDISYNSIFDGPGTRVVVFFQSCNANCVWCHSPHSQNTTSPLLFVEDYCILCKRCESVCDNHVHVFEGQMHSLDRENCKQCGKCIQACPNSSFYKSAGVLRLATSKTSVSKLFQYLLPHLKMIKKIGGITLSGGEALLQKAAVIELLKLCKLNGINTAIETSGLLPVRYYRNLDGLVDYWLFGMRFTTYYPKKKHSELIYNSFEAIKSYGSQILPRIPVVPGHTDTQWYLQACSELLQRNKIKNVFVSPWNNEADHYYKLSGMAECFTMPSIEMTRISERKIKDFFTDNEIAVTDMTEYDYS